MFDYFDFVRMSWTIEHGTPNCWIYVMLCHMDAICCGLQIANIEWLKTKMCNIVKYVFITCLVGQYIMYK